MSNKRFVLGAIQRKAKKKFFEMDASIQGPLSAFRNLKKPISY